MDVLMLFRFNWKLIIIPPKFHFALFLLFVSSYVVEDPLIFYPVLSYYLVKNNELMEKHVRDLKIIHKKY